MNESPVSTLEQKKDRRGLLALIGAGGAAAVAALLTRSNGAQATTGDSIKAGQTTAASAGDETELVANVSGDAAFFGRNNDSGASAIGLQGSALGGIGVQGLSWGGTAVKGTSLATGVEGVAGTVGVKGSGVTGVRGEGKWAVLGKATTAGGAGVIGKTGSGATGVLASATGTKAALQVAGRARFKQAGKATIAAATQAVNVPLGFTLAAGSLVVATLQGYAGAGIAVRYAKTVGTNKIRICLSKNASQNVDVAYFIFTP